MPLSTGDVSFREGAHLKERPGRDGRTTEVWEQQNTRIKGKRESGSLALTAAEYSHTEVGIQV